MQLLKYLQNVIFKFNQPWNCKNNCKLKVFQILETKSNIFFNKNVEQFLNKAKCLFLCP